MYKELIIIITIIIAIIALDLITNNFNRDDIDHILSTLIDNAIKHTDKNKKVIVELIKNKDNMEIIKESIYNAIFYFNSEKVIEKDEEGNEIWVKTLIDNNDI